MSSNHQINQSILEEIEKQPLTPGKKKTIIAAIELFSKQGFQSTTTAQIAKQAGVSEGTIFKYFKTKEQLLNDVLEPLLEQLIPIYQSDFINKFASQKTDDVNQLVKMIVENRYQFLVKNKQLIKILISELLTNLKWKQHLIKIAKQRFKILNDQLNQNFIILLKKYHITFATFFIQLSRILIGYFIQQLVINDELPQNPEKDIKIITKQLLLALDNMS